MGRGDLMRAIAFATALRSSFVRRERMQINVSQREENEDPSVKLIADLHY